ncbi:MAG: TetR/AcrR family transcriptional regulator [Sphingobacteriales bacterium]|nr:TetR/AcrR family transcriptional regulator [Sphingobacteriales bacterium]
MPRTDEQFEAIRKEKRELILRTALKLFAEKGYHSVSISQIAKEAAISKGLMYNYFASKEELLQTIMIAAVDETIGSIDVNKDGILQDEELIFYIRNLFSSVRKNTEYWKFFSALSTQPGIFNIVAGQLKEKEIYVSRLFYEYFNNKGYQNPTAEMAMLGAVLSGAIQKYVFSEGKFPLDEIEERIIKMYEK